MEVNIKEITKTEKSKKKKIFLINFKSKETKLNLLNSSNFNNLYFF
jgi:hypothetical protein